LNYNYFNEEIPPFINVVSNSLVNLNIASCF